MCSGSVISRPGTSRVVDTIVEALLLIGPYGLQFSTRWFDFYAVDRNSATASRELQRREL
ncbi:MAG: hypothetical protein J4N96_04140, partial [Chloroflexi bacterium]|nr:hypothetical protein [Chloroflexota bacterium]